MKRFLIAALLFLLTGLSVSANAMKAPQGFPGKLWTSTLALYGTHNLKTQFLCTAEPIEKIAGGYRLLSAGHCVQDTPADMKFSVAEEIGGTLYPVQMVKAYDGDGLDFSIFDLQTTKSYTLFELGDERDSRVGDGTVNPHFALGLTKQLSFGVISSMMILKSEDCDDDGCVGKFLVQESAGMGGSGSAVLSSKSHKVIGLLVYEFRQGNVGFAVEPISLFAKFMAGPAQPHPGTKAVSAQIPDDVFTAQFGESHSFTLTVHGASPKFIQAGYQFQANTDGFELSDDYYYNVPVYITHDAEGYWLTSTKDGFSVDVTVLGPVT
jgi:hypothetical protein